MAARITAMPRPVVRSKRELRIGRERLGLGQAELSRRTMFTPCTSDTIL